MVGRGVDARIAGDPRFVFIIAFGVTVGIVGVLRFVSMVHSVGVEVAVRSVVAHRYACTAGSRGAIVENVEAPKFACTNAGEANVRNVGDRRYVFMIAVGVNAKTARDLRYVYTIEYAENAKNASARRYVRTVTTNTSAKHAVDLEYVSTDENSTNANNVLVLKSVHMVGRRIIAKIVKGLRFATTSAGRISVRNVVDRRSVYTIDFGTSASNALQEAHRFVFIIAAGATVGPVGDHRYVHTTVYVANAKTAVVRPIVVTVEKESDVNSVISLITSHLDLCIPSCSIGNLCAI